MTNHDLHRTLALLCALPLFAIPMACGSTATAPEVQDTGEQVTEAAAVQSAEPIAEESVKPGINDSFLAEDLNPDRYMGIFEVESREIFAQREGILSAMQLAPGDEIADIGTGTGLFLESMCKAVGDQGMVYAVDISQGMLDFVDERITKESLSPIELVLCGERTSGLAENSVDVMFVCDTYHHFEYPRNTLQSMWQAMRPGGNLFVVDFKRIPGVTKDWLMKHVRADKETFRAEIEEAGFRFEEDINIDGLEDNYMLSFRK